MVMEVMAPSAWLTTTSALSPGTNILSCSRLPLSRLTPLATCPAKEPSSMRRVQYCSPFWMMPLLMMVELSTSSTVARTFSASW